MQDSTEGRTIMKPEQRRAVTVLFISCVLRPDIDAFVLPPDDLTAFSAALERALHNPAALGIGRPVREATRALFDPATHVERILEAPES
jgi:glycosyltransferase involved in cell wall biosynthesis